MWRGGRRAKSRTTAGHPATGCSSSYSGINAEVLRPFSRGRGGRIKPPYAVDADTEEMIIRLRKELSKQGLEAGRQPAAPPAERCNARESPGACPRYAHSVSSGFPRWWRLGLTCTEVVLAAGLVVAAVTEGSWYWWAGAIAAATLALINLSVYLRTERERRRPPDP